MVAFYQLYFKEMTMMTDLKSHAQVYCKVSNRQLKIFEFLGVCCLSGPTVSLDAALPVYNAIIRCKEKRCTIFTNKEHTYRRSQDFHCGGSLSCCLKW